MKLKIRDLESGESRGFRWYRHTAENGKIIMYILAPGYAEPEEIKIGDYTWNDRGFYPFDESVEKGDINRYHNKSYADMNIEEWIAEYAEKPQNCKIAIDYYPYAPKLRLVATTNRNGAVRIVPKNIKITEDPVPQIKAAFRYFERNCPAPEEDDLNTISVSSLGQGIINLLTAEKAGAFGEWHHTMMTVGQPGKQAFYRDLNFSGSDIGMPLIKSVTFHRKHGLKQIIVKIVFEEGHFYSEDDNGASLTLDLPENNIVLASAKGQNLTKLIDIPGADKATIRKTGMKTIGADNGKNKDVMHFRIALEKSTVNLPEVKEDSVEKVYEDLAALMGPNGHFKKAESILVRALEELDPRDLRTVLIHAKNGNYVNLRNHGGPDVSLEGRKETLRVGYSQITNLRQSTRP